MARIRNVHQMQVGAATENSIGNEVLEMRSALRDWGYRSQIYAQDIAPSMRGQARHFTHYRPSPQDLVILHYSTGSALTDYVRTLDVPLVLIYHNITPPEFMTGVGGGEGERARRGREDLSSLRHQAVLALADSEHNRAELVELGFDDPCVLPLIIPDELFHIAPDEGILAQFGADEIVNLLFVGRVVPNKRHEDLIKLLFFYRQINPRARLFLVGSWTNTQRYADWLRQLARRLDLSDAVHFCGHVSTAELASYYRLADVFVCMSEHEGFGIPLVESMRFSVPIVAYASTAIPETLGGAGILIKRKSYPIIAEAIHLLQTDEAFRARIVARQHQRQKVFERERVLADFGRLLELALERLSTSQRSQE